MGNIASNITPTEERQREIKRIYKTPLDPEGFIEAESSLTWIEKQWNIPYHSVWTISNLYYFLLQGYKTDLHYSKGRIIADFLDMEKTVINTDSHHRNELLEILASVFSDTPRREKYLKLLGTELKEIVIEQ